MNEMIDPDEILDDELIGAANRAQQADEYQLGNCSSILHLGYFFDGVGRNIEQDAPDERLSNIAKLYRAFPFQEKSTDSVHYMAHYFSGLGTDFNENYTSKFQAMIDTGGTSLWDDVKSIPEDIATDFIKDAAKSGNGYEALSNITTQLLSPSAWIESFIEKGVKAGSLGIIEGVSFIRDSSWASAFLLSGVSARIKTACHEFAESVKKAQENSPIPLKLISVSLFGFDLGGTLARQFLDELLNTLCEKDNDGKIRYKGIYVDIAFVGLFDCSRHTGASQDNGLDTVSSYGPAGVALVGAALGTHCIEQNTPLPSLVRRSLHLIAAHERRLWRPVFRTGLNSSVHLEKLVPGCSEDIGGGLKANEQKPSAELSLTSLQDMYRTVVRAGIPFPSLKRLKEDNPKVASHFFMKDSVEGRRQIGVRKSVKGWVSEYQKLFPKKTVNTHVLNQHLNSYFVWLGEVYYEYRLELQKLEKNEDKENRYAGIMGGQSGSDMRRAKAASKEVAILKQHWGWLDDVNDEAVKLYNDYHQRGDYRRRNDVRFHHEGLMKNIWYPAYCRAEWFRACKISAYEGLPFPQRPSWALPVDNILFAYFVHDIQARDKSESITDNFFAIRKVELPGDDEVRIKQEKTVQKKEPVAYEPNRSINQAFDMWGKIR
ncbi:hypothetical protein ACY2L5_004329 [Providencia rettgeri]